MLDACKRHDVQFMDGVMFMHSRRLARLRKVLEDRRSVGDIRRITAGFSFCAPPEFFRSNIRVHSRLEPHGCLGDLGWYCIRFALWAMNGQMPRRVTGRILSEFRRGGGSAPVPTEFSGESFFDSGASAGFYCSFLAENQQWATISGSRGYLRVEDFVLPFAGTKTAFELRKADFRMSGCDFTIKPRVAQFTVAERSQSHPTAQESNLFRDFANQVRSGQLNRMWPRIALATQIVMCACRDSAHGQGRAVELNA
jgi:predicted dehydrogenase